jgi:hypothetical protein
MAGHVTQAAEHLPSKLPDHPGAAGFWQPVVQYAGQAHDDRVSRYRPRNAKGETKLSVVLIHQGPTLTREKYEEVVRALTKGKTQLESPSDWPVDGLLLHVSGESPQGFRVVDVWESEDACNRFGEVLEPILKEVGIEVQPEIYEAHTFVSA